MAYPQCLAWLDLETTSLPKHGDDIIDYRAVHVLEVAVILTDFDLNPISGYEEVIKMTAEAAEAIRANDVVREMHTASGLLKASIEAPAENSLAMVEAEVIKLMQTTTAFSAGEFMIAGSGVAAFDLPLINAKMPKLGAWLAYFPFDIGVERRVSRILAGRDLVNPTTASYGAEKAHRALADVKAHITEARKYREFYRSI